MFVFLNGRFVPEEEATISIHDRGFLYGDGLFETLRVYAGAPFLWEAHIQRFEHGCRLLGIQSPLSGGELRCVLGELLRRNGLREAVVRLTLTRGRGLRGYSPAGANHPTLLIVCYVPRQQPATYRVILSKIRGPEADPLGELKHLNKLHQVLARAEADAHGADEALLLNSCGEVTEGTATNVFCVRGGAVLTPGSRGILPGTTRAHVLRVCQRRGVRALEGAIRAEELFAMDGVFVTSSVAEIKEVSNLDGRALARSPLVHELQGAYRSG
jgi:branched-chain amino acid aminotransferase